MLTQPDVRGAAPSVYRAPPPPAYVLRRASEAAPLAPTIHLMGTVASYPRNSEIFGESDPADYLYNVINGGVRTYKIFSDGRRQIGDFYLPGDVVGVQQRMLLLAKTAQERVASFLLEMAERSLGGNAIDLPMPRQDIADYLGLTIETVSRTLTSLESCAAIEVPSSRHIVLRNRSALNRMNG